MNSLTSRIFAGALLTCAANAMAVPVTFSLTAASLTPSSGYGIDGNGHTENHGTKLDVRFTATTAIGLLNPLSFSLSSVNDSRSFLVGKVSFLESSGHGGILPAETNDLGVSASLTFEDPLGSIQTLTASGVATAGRINGNEPLNGGVDYSLVWATLTNIAFGTGGLFDISLNSLSFSFTGDPIKDLNATVTLRTLPSTALTSLPPTTLAQAVPEPASLALASAALLGVAATRRRKPTTPT
jgi:hypothetical protein